MLAKWVLLVGSEQGMPRYLHSLSGLADPVFLTLNFQGVLECSMIMEEIDRRHRHQQLERASHLSALVETTTLNQ